MGKLRTSPLFFLVLGILISTQLVQAKTVYADDIPGSCKIIGDVDVYGIGIRLNFYLQWAAIFLAMILDLGEDARGIRIASNIIVVAVFTNLFLGIAADSILMLEFEIVLTLAVFMTVINFPGMFGGVENTSVEMGVKLLLIVVYVGALYPWLFWRGAADGLKEGCEAFIWSYFKINITSHAWLLLNKVLSCTGPIMGLGLGALGVYKLYEGIAEGLHGKKPATPAAQRLEFDDITWRMVVLHPRQVLAIPQPSDFKLYLRWAAAIMHLALGILSIVVVEETIQINDIDLSAGKLTDSGQLIPFLAGVLGLTTVCWSAIKKIFGPGEDKSPEETELQASIPGTVGTSVEGHESSRAWTSGGDVGNATSEHGEPSAVYSGFDHGGVQRRRTAEMEAGMANKALGHVPGTSTRFA